MRYLVFKIKYLLMVLFFFLSWKDSLGAASITLSQSDHENKDMNPLSQYCPKSMDPTHAIQPFDSTIPLSVLRFSLESSFTDHEDSILSPYSDRKAYSGS